MKYQLQRFGCWFINNTIPILYAIGAIEIMWAYVRDSIPLSVMGAMFILTSLTFFIYEGIEALRPEEKPIKPKITASKPIKETEEQRRQRILDENVENYDGTGKGQIKL